MAYYVLLAVLSFTVLGLLLTVYLMSDLSYKIELWVENAYRRITRK
jgi:hypothetical protein